MVVASYLNNDPRRIDSLMCLVYSIRAQTYKNWELVIIHDGPITDPNVEKTFLDLNKMPLVSAVISEVRKNDFGHSWRHWGICHKATGQYVGLSNDDNYYMPNYFEWMLWEMITKEAELSICNMVHSHRQWQVIFSKPERGYVDAGNWIATMELARSVPWTDKGFAGDWTYFNALQTKARTLAKVKGVLFVHN